MKFYSLIPLEFSNGLAHLFGHPESHAIELIVFRFRST